MTQYTKQKALSIIVNCALKYKENLDGCSILFVLCDKQQNFSFLEVYFHSYNFLHLTGIKLTKKISANDFYHRCLNKKLSPHDFDFSRDGTTQLNYHRLKPVG